MMDSTNDTTPSPFFILTGLFLKQKKKFVKSQTYNIFSLGLKSLISFSFLHERGRLFDKYCRRESSRLPEWN